MMKIDKDSEIMFKVTDHWRKLRCISGVSVRLLILKLVRFSINSTVAWSLSSVDLFWCLAWYSQLYN